MCLRTFQTTPKVADKDITCYKFFRKKEHKEFIPSRYTYHSVFFNTNEPWTLNEAYTTFLYCIEETGLVYNAFHSFKKLTDAQEEAKRYLDVVVAKCVIPEKARYYEGVNISMGSTDGYASDKIKIVEIIEV
jgi:hypothetical protein